MIRPEQLADALQRLEPRDRELLSLSLHRRVPDEALAHMYDYEPAEVSRRRAAAIERLADDLRVQRGEDLGSVLKALLEPGTWAASSLRRDASSPCPRPRSRGRAGAALAAAERSATGGPSAARRARRAPRPRRPPRRPAARPRRCRRRCLCRPVPTPEPEKEPEPPPAALAAVADPPASPPPDEPVLDMLAERSGATRERDAGFAQAS